MNENWRQANPKDQATVILMALEGHIENCSEGIITCEQLDERTKPLLSQLKELQNLLNNWKIYIFLINLAIIE